MLNTIIYKRNLDNCPPYFINFILSCYHLFKYWVTLFFVSNSRHTTAEKLQMFYYAITSIYKTFSDLTLLFKPDTSV